MAESADVLDENPLSYRRTLGRGRSESARLAILDATLSLLETQSLQQVTIEAIAREARVGKATIYRWWPSKASVVIDAFVQNHIGRTPMPEGVSCSEAITVHLRRMVMQFSGWPGRLLAQILADGQSNPEVLREFRERFFFVRRAMVREVLEKGRLNGEFRADFDVEFMMNVVYSPIYLRLIMGHLPLDRAFADDLAQSAMAYLKHPSSVVRSN